MDSIAPGKLANLAFAPADRSEDIRAPRNITMVVRRGHEYPSTDYRPLWPEEYRDHIED